MDFLDTVFLDGRSEIAAAAPNVKEPLRAAGHKLRHFRPRIAIIASHSKARLTPVAPLCDRVTGHDAQDLFETAVVRVTIEDACRTRARDSLAVLRIFQVIIDEVEYVLIIPVND
jgi:hypothetical protein